MSNENVFDLRWGLSVIRRRIWLIIGLMVLTAVIAFIVVSMVPRQYESSVTFLVQPARDSQLSDYNVLMASQQMAITYSEMVKGRPIMQAVITKLGINQTPDDLAKRVTVAAIRDTQLIRITVKDTSPKQATAIANGIAEAFSAQIKALQIERYADSLKGVQTKIDSTTAQVNDLQTKIDDLNTQSVKNNTEIARAQNTLNEQQARYNLLQQSNQSLQNSVTNLADNVKVFAPATLTGTTANGYVASSTLLINEGTVSGSLSTSALQGVDVLGPTYKDLVTSPAVLQSAITKLGVSDSPAALAKTVSAAMVPGTQLIKLSVSNASDKKAVQLADAISEAFISQLRAKLSEPFTTSIATTQEQIDALSKQIDETQANLKTLSSENSNISIALGQMNSNVAIYRNDLRSFQQDSDNLRLTAAAAADNVVVTEQASDGQPAQSRLLYVALAVGVSLIIGVVLAFLLETAQEDERLKKMQPAAAGRNG